MRRVRVAAVAAAVAGVLAGLYGLFGLAVVAGDAVSCINRPTASLLASMPGGFCEATNWVTQFGIGAGLVALGVLGIAVLVLVARSNQGIVKPRSTPEASQ